MTSDKLIVRVAFAGTPEFARLALQALHQAGHTLVQVWTQPDRPAGRGMQLHASPVKQYALGQGLPLAQPQGLRLDGKYAADAAHARQALHAAQPDVMVVAAYGLILPPWVLQTPRLGCLNIHASLLPRWRGAAPIQRAIEAGDAQTGVTIMQMDAGLDTGDMLLAQALPIADTDTAATLHDKLATLGAGLIVQVLAQHVHWQPVPQPAQGVSYAHKIDKAQAQIDWAQPAQQIERCIRAFNPQPGAYTLCGADVLKIWQASAQAQTPAADPARPVVPPGTVLSAHADGACVQCGQGVLRATELQRAGGKRLAAADFLRGYALAPGCVLGVPAPTPAA